MRELLAEVEAWNRSGQGVALATVIKVWGSAPRPIGSHMVISTSGQIAGSVSGGCVEGAVVEIAQRVLETGTAELARFGVSDDVAWSVGLSCGGEIEVFVEPLVDDPLFRDLASALTSEELVVTATVIAGAAIGRRLLVWSGGQVRGDLGTPRLNQRASAFADRIFGSLAPARRDFDHQGVTTEVFFGVYPPPPRLIVIGAVHVAVHLVDFARKLGFRTVVIDPRGAFATAERFAEADELIVGWPAEALADTPIHETTYFAVLSHDFKIDIPALEVALGSPSRYVGVLGSKKTHARRVERLLEEGVSRQAIDRLHAPIGLDLGGRRAEEVALSIISQIVAVRHGKA